MILNIELRNLSNGLRSLENGLLKYGLLRCHKLSRLGHGLMRELLSQNNRLLGYGQLILKEVWLA